MKPRYKIMQTGNGLFNPYVRKSFLWWSWWVPFWYFTRDNSIEYAFYGYRTVEACEAVIQKHRELSDGVAPPVTVRTYED